MGRLLIKCRSLNILYVFTSIFSEILLKWQLKDFLMHKHTRTKIVENTTSFWKWEWRQMSGHWQSSPKKVEALAGNEESPEASQSHSQSHVEHRDAKYLWKWGLWGGWQKGLKQSEGLHRKQLGFWDPPLHHPFHEQLAPEMDWIFPLFRR